jgi:acyl carrier protein
VAALQVDWGRLAASIPLSPLWAAFAGASARQRTEAGALVAALRGAPKESRLSTLIDHVRRQLIAVLGWDSPAQIGSRQKLFDLGVDSITSVELQHSLEKTLGCSLPLTVAFDYPTVEALARFLAKELDLELAAAPPVSAEREPEELPAQVERVAAMSDEQIESLLAEKFQDLLYDE